MIPHKAVEVAARRIADMLDMGANNWEWHADNARDLLLESAPFIAAHAWDEGRNHGARYPFGERGLATDDNPYRKAS